MSKSQWILLVAIVFVVALAGGVLGGTFVSNRVSLNAVATSTASVPAPGSISSFVVPPSGSAEVPPVNTLARG